MLVLDIDGVLADTNASLYRYLEKTLGVVRERDADEYHGIHKVFPEHYQENAKELIKMAFRYDSGSVYSDCDPFPGAVTAAQWADEQDILIGYVTRRPPRVALQTIGWLSRWGFPIKTIMFNDGTPHKGYAMRSLGARVIIEDSPKEAKCLYDAGLKVLLVDMPYNTGVTTKIERVLNVQDGVFWASQFLNGYKDLVEANERLGEYADNA